MVSIILWYVTRHSVLGRRMAAVGGNQEAARLSGINVERMRTAGFIIVGIGAAVAAVIITSQAASDYADAATGLLIPAYAGVFLGAAVLRPGRVPHLGHIDRRAVHVDHPERTDVDELQLVDDRRGPGRDLHRGRAHLPHRQAADMSVPAAEPAGGAAGAPEPVAPLLEARGLSKRFPGVVALDDVSVSVRAGEVHGLVGENGAGKSTLLKIVSGVYSIDDGELLWKGEPVAFKGPPEAVKRGIELIPQELDLALGLSAAENIMMGIYPSQVGRVRWREVNRKAREIAATVHLEADLRRKCATLSPAEQRLVMIARALARNASLVIMDEPTVALSEVEVDALKTVVRELRQNGVTVIYVSHRLDEVLELTDRVTVMKDGRVMSTEDTANMTKPRMIEQIIGRAYGEQFPQRREPGSADPLLRVRNLSRGFVRDISFDLRPGEILGLAGLVGSGRSEIVRMVFGADPREAGEIEMDGRPVKLKNPGTPSA